MSAEFPHELDFKPTVDSDLQRIDETYTHMREARQGFLNACSAYLEDSCQENHDALFDSRDALPNLFGDAIRATYEAHDFATVDQVVSEFFNGEDTAICALINELLGPDTLRHLPSKFIGQLVDEITEEAGTEASMIKRLVHNYKEVVHKASDAVTAEAMRRGAKEAEDTIRVLLGDIALNGTHPLTLEDGLYVPFTIEPPLEVVHDPYFMGPEVTLGYDDEDVTHGKFWVERRMRSERRRNRMYEHIQDFLSQELNPFGEKQVVFDYAETPPFDIGETEA